MLLPKLGIFKLPCLSRRGLPAAAPAASDHLLHEARGTLSPCKFSPEPCVKNVTITVDEETAAWARVYAAERNMSVSRLIGEILRERMREAHEYDGAMRRFLAKEPVRLKASGQHYASREAVHDRTRLR
jgi:hypothetical protein